MNIPGSGCENFPKSSRAPLGKRGLRGGRFLWFQGEPKGAKKLVRMVVLPALALGLMVTQRTASARHSAEKKRTPVIIFQDHRDLGPAIIPNDGGTRLEYRKVLFRGQSMMKAPRKVIV